MSNAWRGIEVASTGVLAAQPWGQLHVDINGHTDVTQFGTKFYETAPGRYRVEIGYTDGLGGRGSLIVTRAKPKGKAQVVVEVAPGEVVHLEYRVPLVGGTSGKIVVN
jgi:hypothetical protein